MKKIVFIGLFLIVKFNSYSQRIEGYVVTNSNDTIKCKFFVTPNMFNRTIIYKDELCLLKKLKILTNSGEKKKYRANELKSFFVTGTSEGDFKFVSLNEDNYNHFYHEVIKGKISYYRLYKGVDGTKFNEYIIKSNLMFKLGIFNTRKTLGEQIKDYPELYEKWMDSNNFYTIDKLDEVIKLYNEHFIN